MVILIIGFKMADKDENFPVFRNFPGIPFFDEDLWKLEEKNESGLSVSEDNNNIYVEAHLPGLKPEDIELTYDKGMLWIHGEKHEQEQDKKKKYYKKASSSFSYRVQIPGLIDDKKEPEAVYRDGIMKVNFAKSAKKESKKIKFKSK